MSTNQKIINLALQGGGAHGAFAWGVLDRLMEDGRLAVDGLSATSAGAMNAAVYAYGKMKGGPEGARQALEDFWRRISRAGSLFSPVSGGPAHMLDGWVGDSSLPFLAFEALTRSFSPYEFNPFNFNPLRTVLEESVDFNELKRCRCTNLFISATNVRTGRVAVFTNEEMSADVVLASCCLPFLFQAVEIDGEAYWDGGYMGNPSLFPLIYNTTTSDVVVVHINPINRQALPRRAPDIMNRINEISFNSSLMREMRAVAFVTKMIDEDWLKPECKARLRRMYIHAIRTDDVMSAFSVASKFRTDWAFLTKLRDLGRAAAKDWLAQALPHIGRRSSVDLAAEYM